MSELNRIVYCSLTNQISKIEVSPESTFFLSQYELFCQVCHSMLCRKVEKSSSKAILKIDINSCTYEFLLRFYQQPDHLYKGFLSNVWYFLLCFRRALVILNT